MPETKESAELQRVILDLGRLRNGVVEEIEAAEDDPKRALPSYERGKAYGLNLALNRLGELQRRLEVSDAQ